MTQRMRAMLIPIALAVTLLLGSCSPLPDPPVQTATPTSTGDLVKPILAPYQPYRVGQYCPDVTSSYPQQDFAHANAAIADWIDQAVAPNQGGLVVYVNLINSNSFDPTSTVLTIVVPPFPADPARPEQLAAPTPTGNYITDNNNKDKVQQENQKLFNTWQQTLKERHQQLAQLRKAVHAQTNKLRALHPPIDNVSTDIYGCVKRASLRFQGLSGKKILLLATDLGNNTWQEWTPSFPLTGANVEVIWHYCSDAPTCDANDGDWQRTFAQAGAARVALFDPARSLTIPNPFVQ